MYITSYLQIRSDSYLKCSTKINKRKKTKDGSGCHLNKHTEGNFKMMVKT